MKSTQNPELFRELPSVDEVLRTESVTAFASLHGAGTVTEASRSVLNRLREEISAGHLNHSALRLALEGLPAAIEREILQRLKPSLLPVINATGVILHTNLGRAPLIESAFDRMRETAGSYSNLEFDVDSGSRGKRDLHVDGLIRQLLHRELGSGTEISTIIVNNNAAAVLLALNTLAEDGEVVVSRGELVEIGGSFRIPDVMSKSAAILREVGTTNRTRIVDYENAVNDRTRLLLRVHRSNFEITGFVEQPSITELVSLARERGVPLMEDLGSGALIDLRNFGISGEASVLDSLRAGVDIVTYSGDKLLGGPQAGFISGRTDLVARMRANSLFRALRVDKLTYAAIEATLLAYMKNDHDAIPALRMMRLTKEEIGKRAESLAVTATSEKLHIDIVSGESVVGGGAAPSATLPTRVLALTHADLSAHELAARLRACDPPIIARVEDERVLLDLRTVFAEQDELVAKALARIA